jgi:hypothetical protein
MNFKSVLLLRHRRQHISRVLSGKESSRLDPFHGECGDAGREVGGVLACVDGLNEQQPGDALCFLNRVVAGLAFEITKPDGRVQFDGR